MVAILNFVLTVCLVFNAVFLLRQLVAKKYREAFFHLLGVAICIVGLWE